ncbi:MAG: hypothetical protein E7365_03515 [Clostridiales bacterium]|nr:hypothetical protein [Clostridiales bacterium]
MQILLNKNMPFFKAAMHCHSTNSDGKLSVQEQKELFKKQGYSVVAFTDHEHLIDNSFLDDKDFLTITSCEIAIKEFPKQSTLKNTLMRVTHLNLYAQNQHNVVTPCYNSVYDHFKNPNIEDKIKFNGEYNRIYSKDGINAIIKEAKSQGFLVSYNHPDWSLEDATDYLQYENFDFVEIYNHTCSCEGGEGYQIKVFDDILRSGKKVFATMADDSHKKESMFGAFIMINAPELNYDTIMTALKNGEFYSSQGPLIYSLIKKGNEVTVECSSAKRISISTKGRRCDAKTGKDLTKATFKLKESDGYFRITVIDEFNNHAHSQAYEI